MKGLEYWAKEFRFFPLKDIKQGCDMIRCAFQKVHSGRHVTPGLKGSGADGGESSQEIIVESR